MGREGREGGREGGRGREGREGEREVGRDKEIPSIFYFLIPMSPSFGVSCLYSLMIHSLLAVSLLFSSLKTLFSQLQQEYNSLALTQPGVQ